MAGPSVATETETRVFTAREEITEEICSTDLQKSIKDLRLRREKGGSVLRKPLVRTGKINKRRDKREARQHGGKCCLELC